MMEGRDVGNHANIVAALKWQRNMMHHTGASNMTPHGGFVMDPKDMRFKPPPIRKAFQASVHNSTMQLSKLNQMMECAATVGGDPQERAADNRCRTRSPHERCD